MSMRYLGGFITASYNPLKVPNAPTIGTVTAGNAQVSVAFTAPSNVGGGAITSYTVVASNGTTASGTSSPIVVTGLTNGVAYTFQVFATNSYGPSAFSATSGSATPMLAGYLWSWGSNGNGELGQNNRTAYSSPVQVGASNNWKESSSGSLFTTAVKTDGTLWSWGVNNYGQLGQSDKVYRSSPVQVGALTTWSSVSCGDTFVSAIKTDGTLWTWGSNVYGELGQNNLIYRSSPVQVGTGTDWYITNCAQLRLLALKTNNTLWGTGAINLFGGIGSKSSPTQIGASTWSDIGSGYGHVGLVRSDGTLWLTGDNNYGQLGLNNTTYTNSPIQVGALTNWSKISCTIISSQGMSASIKTDGTLWTWGSDLNGQLGNNTVYQNKSSPVQIGALTNWSSIQVTFRASLSTKTDGTLWVWGLNNSGQLGLGNTQNKSSPTQVGSGTTWIKASGGSGTSFAIKS